jgi:hypothetical protein
MKKGVVFIVLVLLSLVGFVCVSGWISTDTEIYQEGIKCRRTVDGSVWQNISSTGSVLNSFEVFNSSRGNVGNCSKFSGESLDATCCPINYDCVLASGNCTPAGQNENFCVKLNTPGRCAGYRDEGARTVRWLNPGYDCNGETVPFPFGGVICLDSNECGCVWNGTSGVCEAFWNTTTFCESGQKGSVGECIYTYDSQENRCETDGKIILKYEAIFNSPSSDTTAKSNCINITKEFPCSSVTVVPFFGWVNFFVALSALTAGYLIFGRKR